jgi:gas vesicle protein
MRYGNYESSKNSTLGTAVTFLLIGVGIGAGVALALAPKTGKQFRRDLRRGYEGARGHVRNVRSRARDVGDRIRDVAERGASFAEDLRDRVGR